MNIKRIETSGFQTNCYIVWSNGEGLVIDPASEEERINDFIKEKGLDIKYIILTHGHFDHIGALKSVKERTGADIMIHTMDAPMLTDNSKNLSGFFGAEDINPPADRLLNDNDKFTLGDLNIKILHTPGHTLGGICLQIGDVLFTGDTLFKDSIGRTDLPGGNYTTIINSIKTKLLGFPDTYVIYPGHGESSSIGHERLHNQYILEDLL